MFDYTNIAQSGFDPSILIWVPILGVVISFLVIWSLLWKGLALWHAARRGQNGWFLAMLVFNTAGILEIIYLFGVAKIKFADLFK